MRIFIENSERMTKEPLINHAPNEADVLKFRAGQLTQFAYEVLPQIFIDEAFSYWQAHEADLPENPVQRERAEQGFERQFMGKWLYILISDYDGCFGTLEKLMNCLTNKGNSLFIDACYKEALRVNPGLNREKADELNLINPTRQKEADEPETNTEENQEAENKSFLPDSAPVQSPQPRPARSKQSRRRKR